MNIKSARGISKVSAAVITALSMSTLSLPVFAQEAAAEENNDKVEVIMVTAQKRMESLQEVPISMSVATESQLERDQINSLNDLNRIAPGLEIVDSFGGDASGGGRVRGIGTNIFNEGASGSVAVVIDEVPSGNIAMPSIFDMAQVEVLRGPQGTLFGQSASVGVINITTKAPDPYEFSGYASINYSKNDFESRILEGSVNIPVSENSALRFSLRSDVSDGQYNKQLDETNESKKTSGRVRYLVEPSDELTIDLSAEYHEIAENHNFFAVSQAPILGTGPIQDPDALLNTLLGCGVGQDPLTLKEDGSEYCSPVMPYREKDFLGLAAKINWDVADFTLTSISSYREKNLDDVFLNYSRVSPGGGANPPQSYVGPNAQVWNTGREGKQWTQELRLATNTNDNYTYILGAYFSNYHTTTHPTNGGSPLTQDNLAGFGVCTFNYSGVHDVGPSFCGEGNDPSFLYEDIEVSVQAIFADGTYDINDEVSVFGGLRFTRQVADYTFDTLSASVARGEDVLVGEQTDNEPSGRLGIRWKASSDAMYYASIARGFKGSLVSPSENSNVDLEILEPELSTSFEIGSKISLMDNALVLDSNIFYMTVENYQAQTAFIVAGELVSQPTSVEEVESYGIELNARGNLTDELSLNGGYLYNSVQYPDGYLSDDPVSLGGPVDLGGEQLYLAPEHKVTISADYYQEVSETVEAYFTLNANYKSEVLMQARAAEGYKVDAHWNLGGSIGLRSIEGDWNVSIYGRNLTDEAVPAAYLASQTFGAENGGIRFLAANGVSNRQIGITAKYNF